MKRMKRFPTALWILPIVFGLIGGAIAALIANLKYQASWWELLVVGFVISFLASIIYLAIYLAALSVMLTTY